jgi:hypothetical protein
MTDYGMRKKHKGLPLGWMALVILVVLVGLGAHFGIRSQQPKWIEEARHWVVKGPPCTQVSAAAFKARAPINETFQFDDALFARAYGMGSCAQVHKNGGRSLGTVDICQFSSPTTLSVHTSKGDTYYEAEVGKPIAVTIDHGQVSCARGQSEFPPAG